MLNRKDTFIAQTANWLEQVVIGLNFCPFARPVFEQAKVHYQVSEAQSLASALEDLIKEAARLDQQGNIETTLLIYTQVVQNFDDFLDLVEIANELLTEQGYEGIYQLASFHPDYCFTGSDTDDPANYTNRSPYPMLHLIREKSIELALTHYVDPESIPENNIQLARKLGLKKMQNLLEETKTLKQE